MIKALCVEKYKDKNGNIIGYKLQDNNGVQLKFDADQVKKAIFLKQLEVINLKLTSDGRLISTNILESNDIIKICNYLDRLMITEVIKNTRLVLVNSTLNEDQDFFDDDLCHSAYVKLRLPSKRYKGEYIETVYIRSRIRPLNDPKDYDREMELELAYCYPNEDDMNDPGDYKFFAVSISINKANDKDNIKLAYKIIKRFVNEINNATFESANGDYKHIYIENKNYIYSYLWKKKDKH